MAPGNRCETPVGVPVVAVVAIVAGLLLGPLDLAGQVAAPYPVANLFNSPAVWAAAGFAFGAWTAHAARGAFGAVVLLAVAVEAYYLADVIFRGADTSNLTSGTAKLWLVGAVLAGLLFGAAGALARIGHRWVQAVAIALLPSVFFAEAARQLVRHATVDADGRPDDLIAVAVLLLALGLGGLVVQLQAVSAPQRRRAVLATLAVTAAGTLVYGLASA